MRRPRVQLGILFFVLLCSGCSSNRLRLDQFKADLTNSISFAAETEMFLMFLAQGKAPTEFAEGHAIYLEHEVEKLEKELSQSSAEISIQKPLNECRTQVELLLRELQNVSRHVDEPDELTASRTRISNLRTQLIDLGRVL
jgi:hypothetical protein